jgi:SM-20-related protein
MCHLNIDLLESADLRSDPFEYTVVPSFLSTSSLNDILAHYPALKGGSYPLDSVDVPPAVQALIDEMDGPEFEQAIEKKFDVSLKGQPKMYSLRGYCRRTDGKMHTDSKDKIITVLLYLNQEWDEEGGKLRMLRSGTDIDDYSEEVPPDNGTLLVFRRSDNSWHGHGPFEGKRCSIQMNWMVSEGARGFHKLRHSISAKVKKLMSA